MFDETEYFTVAGKIITVVGILLIAMGAWYVAKKEDDENSGSY